MARELKVPLHRRIGRSQARYSVATLLTHCRSQARFANSLLWAVSASCKQLSTVSARLPVVPHRATQIRWSDYADYDYIIGMDGWNMKNLHRMLNGDPDGKLYKLLSFAGSDRDIADPWYTGNFDETYDDVAGGGEGFLRFLRESGKI